MSPELTEFIASETPEAAYEEFKARIAELEDELTAMFPSNVLDNLSASGVDMVLNVYGSEDLLAKDLKINGVAFGGYRDNIGGYTTLDRNKTLINVEIAGATHFDYMRRGDWISNINNVINPADEQWNREVADFVARLVANSKTIDSVNAYMAELKKIELAEFKNNRWIVSLPGSGLRTQNGAQ